MDEQIKILSDDELDSVAGGTAHSEYPSYTIKRGDNLVTIADEFGTTWRKIYDFNKAIIKDPNFLKPGWVIKIPVIR